MAIQCVAERRSPVTASSFAKSRRSSASTLSSKDNFGITSSGPHGRKESRVKTFCSCLSAAWIMLSIGRDFRLRGVRREVENRSEEHTSELQSHSDLVCRLLLEKKK